MKKLSINGTRNDILDIKVKVGSNKWRDKRLVSEMVGDLYQEVRKEKLLIFLLINDVLNYNGVVYRNDQSSSLSSSVHVFRSIVLFWAQSKIISTLGRLEYS